MKNKLVILLLTAMLILTAACSGNDSNSEVTTEESAVGDTTADSDTSDDLIAVPVEKSDRVPVVNADSKDLTCILPTGFKQYHDEVGLYVNSNYPKDSATISYVISESDEDITQMTQEEYKNQLETGYLEDYGDQVEINITQYEKITVSGISGLKIMFNFEFKGVGYEQLTYLFYCGNESHILNYTQEKGGKWMEKYIESAETIALN